MIARRNLIVIASAFAFALLMLLASDSAAAVASKPQHAGVIKVGQVTG